MVQKGLKGGATRPKSTLISMWASYYEDRVTTLILSDTDGLAVCFSNVDEEKCLREGVDLQQYRVARSRLFVNSDSDKYTPGKLKLEFESGVIFTKFVG
ncbi:MAG: hypothetical protein GY820_27945 [Gammaproteobacteria bacterium]|nr:hypothetical protein [Gammaproteobacteria bacterium]